jgi:hypothetical protein
VRHLGLPREITNQLNQNIHEERLMWEPWVEAAESFKALQSSLKNRGYRVPRRLSIRFPSNGAESSLQGLNKTQHSPKTQTNRVLIRRTMLGS